LAASSQSYLRSTAFNPAAQVRTLPRQADQAEVANAKTGLTGSSKKAAEMWIPMRDAYAENKRIMSIDPLIEGCGMTENDLQA